MKRFPHVLIFLLAFSSCTASYDLIVRGGVVYDGLGKGPKRLDIGIRDGRIAALKRDLRGHADRELYVEGKAVAPGFIDVHAHLEPLSLYPDAKSHLMQGVTTALGGPDGSSPMPIGSYLDSLSAAGVGLNVGYLIGHNTVRTHVMGLEDRSPSNTELAEMEQLIDEAMDQGAFGISTGLKYLPGTFAKTEEVIALSKVAAAKGGIYTSHLREEGLGLLEGVGEAIQIARESDIPVVLTHHKVIGQPMWGASTKTLQMVDSARAIGLDIRMDQYPYTASHTWLGVIIPPWALEGDPYQHFAERCQDPILRDSIKRGIIHSIITDRGGNDLRRIQFAKIDWKPEYMGRTLHDLVVEQGLEPTIENGAEMVIEIQLHRGANCIYHVMADEDVERIMQHPFSMVASDGRITQFGKGHPHPRAYGTFPRVLGHYVREKQVISLQEAIRKMTSLPAETMGLLERGQVRNGWYADLVIFDPATVIDMATFQKPHAYPEGIEHVIVNGQLAVSDGEFHDVRAGEALRKIQQ